MAVATRTTRAHDAKCFCGAMWPGANTA